MHDVSYKDLEILTENLFVALDMPIVLRATTSGAEVRLVTRRIADIQERDKDGTMWYEEPLTEWMSAQEMNGWLQGASWINNHLNLTINDDRPEGRG